MKGLALFAAGILVGVLATHTVTAQDSAPRALSHVGIAVKDFDATLPTTRRRSAFAKPTR